MPTLDWIGKKAVVNHHHQVPYRLLKDVPDLSVGDPGTGNLIVEGDNLLALKTLLPYYAGQVKCIYIDPPYNTGNEGWVYNDNVNNGVNVLTRAILARLPPHEGPKIVYGAGCLLGLDRLRDEGIAFRQTPYEVRVS
jgi:hypothetical protein